MMPMPVLLIVVAALLAVPAASDARVTRVEIERVESPTFEGRSFGDVGPYEKLVGRVHGEVDPAAPENAVIADIERAPRNARGLVEYSADLIILRPVDPARGNGRLFFELNNRGRLLSLNRLNEAAAVANDPTSAADAGNGFLMRQGYTFVSAGWDATASSADGRLNITLPVAVNADGSPIVGPALEELVIDNDTTTAGRLSYPAATLDTTQASLTVRTRYGDEPEPLGPDAWEYVDAPHHPAAAGRHRVSAGQPLPPGLSGHRAAGGGTRVRGRSGRGRVPAPRRRRCGRDGQSAGRADPLTPTRSPSRSRRGSCAISCTSASTRTRPAGVSSTAC